jgi:hypothetical protein
MSEELRLRLVPIFLFFCVSTFSSASSAEEPSAATSRQLWVNFIISRPKSEKLYFEYDIEGARLGLGFRRSYQWRFEALAMRDETRETLDDEEVDIEALMLDLRIKWFF